MLYHRRAKANTLIYDGFDRAGSNFLAKSKTQTVSFLALRLVMITAALPALVYGTTSAVNPEFMAAVARTLSNARGTMTPDMAYLAKPLGLYVALYGGLLLFAVKNPVKYRAIVHWAALLLALRAVQRFAMSEELFQLYQISFLTNLGHVAWLTCLAIGLYVLRPPCADYPIGTSAPEYTSAPLSNKKKKALIRAYLD